MSIVLTIINATKKGVLCTVKNSVKCTNTKKISTINPFLSSSSAVGTCSVLFSASLVIMFYGYPSFTARGNELAK